MPEETTSKSPDRTNPQKVEQADPQKVSEDVAAEGSEAIPNPAAGESKTPSAAEEHAPSTDEPQATDLPTGSSTAATEPNKAKLEAKLDAVRGGEGSDAAMGTEAVARAVAEVVPESKEAKKPKPADKRAKQAEETEETAAEDSTEDKKKPKPEAKGAAAKKAKATEESETGKPAAEAGAKKPKKEAKPAVEDKPFVELIQQYFLPALEKAIAAKGIQDLQLIFENSQVTGCWNQGQRQFQFTVYFPEEDIQGRKAFSWAEGGTTPSTLEPFLSDERKVTLELLVFYVLQRLNAQKWLGGN